MSWKEVTILSQRQEFITLALQEGTNFSELCRRFNISRKTGYKFLKRFKEEGGTGLKGQSKRPKHSPGKTSEAIEQLILDFRDKHSAWGGKKLKQRLENMGYTEIPAPSTVTAILKRNGRILAHESEKHKAWQRFEADSPNDLWQMDFKGHFPAKEGRCHPLTVLDDHSRYSLCIAACENERKKTVQPQLIDVFRTYGLPWRILMDNGPPWGNRGEYRYTVFTAWLMRLGIKVSHSRPLHPQTLGKDERFHRTMKAEILADCVDKPLGQCQRLFNRWRTEYNTERPHESLRMDVPASCYRISKRPFPEKLPTVEYELHDEVRKVYDKGKGFISFRGKEYRIGKAFAGQRVAVRPTQKDGVFDVFFCDHKVAKIDLL